MASRSMGATLSLKDGNFFTNMNKANTAAKGLKTTLSGSGGAVKTFGSSLAGVATKAAAAIGTFVSLRSAINFGKDVIETGKEFEQSMANVSAISGSTGDELDKLSQKAMEMGSTTVYTASEAADAMSYMALAGWGTQEMLDGISGIMNLAAASGGDLATVSDIVTDNLTAFNLTAADSNRLADAMAAAMSKSNTDVLQLGEAFTNCAATAGAMGYQMEDVTTALGLMANAGVKGSNAGTSMKNIMTRLAKPTAEVSSALDALNISAVNSDGSMKSLKDLIPELQTAFSGLTESERGQYGTMIAGKNALSGFLSIVNASPDDFYALSDAIYNSDGAAQNMADTMNNTLSGQLTLLKSQFDGVKLAIYQAFSTADGSKAQEVVKKVSEALEALSPVIENVSIAIGNKIFDAIDAVYNTASRAFQSIKKWIEENQPAIDSLKGAFENFKNSLGGLFDRLFEGDEDGGIVSGLMGTIVPTLTAAMDAISGAVDVAAPILGTLKDAFEGVANFLTEHGEAMVPIIEKLFKAWLAWKGLSFLSGTAGTIKNLIGGFSGIGSALSAVKGGFSLVKNFGDIPAAFSTIGEEITSAGGGAFTTAFGELSSKAGGLMSGVFTTISSVGSNLGGVFTTVLGGAAKGLGAAFSFITSPIGIAVVAIGAAIAIGVLIYKNWDKIKETVINLWNKVKEVFENIKNKVSEVWDSIKNSAPVEFLSNIFGGVKEAASTVWTAAKDTVVEKLNNIKSAYEEHGGGIKGVAYAAMEGVKGYYTAGYTFIDNLTGGKLSEIVGTMKEKFEPVAEFFSNTWENVKGSFSTAFDTLKVTTQEKLDNIKSAYEEHGGGLKGAAYAAMEGVKEYYTAGYDYINNLTGGKLSEVVATIQEKFAPVIEFFSGVWETIKTTFFTVWNSITTSISTIFTTLQTTANNLWNSISSAAQAAFSTIQSAVQSAISTVCSIIKTIQTTFSNVFNTVKDTVTSVFNTIKTTISNAWDSLKSLIKTPHIEVTGTMSIAGIDTPIPKLGLKWYAEGGIMTRPTIFGANGNNVFGGGEAGHEAVLPLDVLWERLGDFADKIVNGGAQPARAAAVTNNNNITVTVEGGANDPDLPNKVAKRIVEVLNNM